MSKHTLSVLVENKPGILARIAALFSRRGFNIDSLAVGVTEHPDISRITIVVNVEDLPLEQVTKQLNKLVNVLKIVELEPGAAIQRELVLVKVRADNETRSQIVEIVQLFRAKTVDVSPEAVTIEATGSSRQARGDAEDAGAVRHQGARPVRHDRHRARCPVHHRPVPARSGPQRLTAPAPRSARIARPVALPPPTPPYGGTHTCTPRRYSSGRAVLRRRCRPVHHPEPQGRGHRLRQPGPRPRAVAP